eukprot:CAMPEP_0198251964 /NCGR_PEP_ID=MMETSP1447-20131203/2614_1 /TAXON_ID=420782 /ORGANISM="Chaetoceros dichaeta, Strain CCMP1751" /LENGTH=672 /DNA_ID=CAMNT_0043937099 /DNA_START=104 /DNA_END=2122 /DNA_ORIENTATION=+
MGNLTSICRGGEKDDNHPIVSNIGTVTKRENMATWHRTDIAVTDVYDIVETIGKGRMGEVYKVMRHVEDRGLHNNDTRTKSIRIHRSKSEPTIDHAIKSQAIHRGVSEPSTDGESKPKPILRTPSRGNLLNMNNSQGSLVGTMGNRDSSNNASGAPDEDSEGSGGTAQESVCSVRSVSNKLNSFIFDSDEDDNVSQRSIVSTESTKGLSKKKKNSRKARLRFQRTYACKTVETADIKQKQLEEMMKEIYVMRTLDHPYIIRLYEVYQVKQNIWMIMDLCTGGDLTSRKLNEQEVVIVAEQILRGVVYLHRNGVCHQDLKLENILYEHSGTDASIRLIDFGISEKYDQNGKLRMTSGAVYTMSPEISSGTGPYTEKSDVWAVGVIVWVLLAGDYPFLRRDDDLKNKEKRDALNNADYDYGITWRGRDITSQAKRFVAGCLRKQPDKRWSAKTALAFVKETWVPGLEEKALRTSQIASKVSPRNKALEINMDDIARFCECGLLKQTVLITMANTMDRAEVGDLEDLFLLLDSDNTGTICIKELREAFIKLGLPSIKDEKLQQIFSVIDHDNSGQIHYAEFLAALAESHGLVTTDRLADAFDRIDTNGKGFITHEDLKAILGENYKSDVVENMIQEADFKNNGKVDYDELLQLMFGEEEKCELQIGESSTTSLSQ